MSKKCHYGVRIAHFALRVCSDFDRLLAIVYKKIREARAKIRVFLDAVPMDREDLLVDLGCGDGRVLRAARKR